LDFGELVLVAGDEVEFFGRHLGVSDTVLVCSVCCASESAAITPRWNMSFIRASSMAC
jgi:hypothetical protein